jgi:hypothetical protein
MQLRTYSDLLSLIQSLAGVSSFTEDEKPQILNFVNRRAFEAYNISPIWPRYLVSSQSRDLNVYSLSGSTGTTTVNQNYKLIGSTNSQTASVKANTNLYQGVTTSTIIIYKNSDNAWIVDSGGSFLQDSDGNYTVTVGSAVFTEADTNKKGSLELVEVWTGTGTLLVERKNLIPYTQGTSTISEFIRIHRKKAFLNNSALEYDFFVDSFGANILNIVTSDATSAFVTYKKPLTLFTQTSEDIPAEFFYFIGHAAYADFLRMDGQHSKAISEEQLAKEYLDLELEKIDLRSNNNSINHKFSTYVNRQSR